MKNLTKGQLKIIKSPKKFQSIFSQIHICKDEEGKEFLFKETNSNEVIRNEIIAWNLLKLIKIRRISYVSKQSLGKKKGLTLTYLKKARLLSKRKLTKKQLNQLKKIILFDIWVGNRDRHTANIFLYKNNLIPFDHGKIFKEKTGKSIRFIKLNVGTRLSKEWPDILVKLQNKTNEEALKILGFTKREINYVENINDSKIKKACLGNNQIFNFLKFRRNNFTKFKFY